VEEKESSLLKNLANESEISIKRRRFYGGEVDGNSRQLARYIYKTVSNYML